jgi:hypothetical protein
MDMPKPGPEHAALQVFAGTWEGRERMPPSPWSPTETTADGRIVSRQSLGGFAIVQDYVQSSDGVSRYEGHGVLTWDGAAKEYCLYWLDSMGSPVNTFRGKRDGDTWTFMSRDARGHTRSAWEFTSRHSYRHTMEVSPDGKTWSTFMDGTYRKV